MLDKKHSLATCEKLQKDRVEQWINNGPDPESILEVEIFGKYIARDLKRVKVPYKKRPIDESVSTSQIRQVFTKLKTIEAKGGIGTPTEKTQFLMLKPLVAYASGKHDKTGLKQLKKRLDWAIDEVMKADNEDEQQTRFKHFCRLFEAILAYHRAYGGK